jgi:hypothetical protein
MPQTKKYVAPKYADEPVEKFFLIVNPAGCMHVVSEEIARDRLKNYVGWRLATSEEKAAYKEADGNQRARRPLAKPFNPSPEMSEALPAEEAVDEE